MSVERLNLERFFLTLFTIDVMMREYLNAARFRFEISSRMKGINDRHTHTYTHTCARSKYANSCGMSSFVLYHHIGDCYSRNDETRATSGAARNWARQAAQ